VSQSGDVVLTDVRGWSDIDTKQKSAPVNGNSSNATIGVMTSHSNFAFH